MIGTGRRERVRRIAACLPALLCLFALGSIPVTTTGFSGSTTAAADFKTATFVTTASRMFATGKDVDGQLGVRRFADEYAFAETTAGGTWTDVEVSITTDTHACGLRTDGSVWCWGKNASGQIGLGSTNSPIVAPAQVGTATDWVSVKAGAQFSCARKSTGTLWCWGLNSSGQLGRGNTTSSSSPGQVGTDADWASVTAGINHTCATKTTGTLWCWGGNGSGQLGRGDTVSPATSPIQVGTATDWSSVTAGGSYTCATRTDGTLW